jgi:hypothetical protein
MAKGDRDDWRLLFETVQAQEAAKALTRLEVSEISRTEARVSDPPIGILQEMDVDIDFHRPPETMELHRDCMVVGEPIDLGAEPPGIPIEGFPLADLGLKRALIRQPDGSLVPLVGFTCERDESLSAAIARAIGPGATLVNDAGEELILPDITGEEAMQISLSRAGLTAGRSHPATIAQAIAEMKVAAGLTDDDIDAELAAYNAERR